MPFNDAVGEAKALGRNGLRQEDPSQTLSRVSNEQQAFYNDVYRPLAQGLIGEVNSTEMVDTAKANAGTNYAQGLQRNERQRSRLGYNDTALDQARQAHTTALDRGAMVDGQINQARTDQYERNVGLRNELINVSRGIAGQATDSLGTAANLQTQRENTNDSIDAQNRAAKYQTMGQIGGMLALAFI